MRCLTWFLGVLGLEEPMKPRGVLTDAQRVEMLVDFVGLAMDEDCQGVALSDDMETVESWLAAYCWLQTANRDDESYQEELEGLEAIERRWLEGSEESRGE
jgi:hypothetical protein